MHYANEFAVGRRLSSENSSTFRILQGLATGAGRAFEPRQRHLLHTNAHISEMIALAFDDAV